MIIDLQDDLLGNTKVGKSIELQNVSPVDDNKRPKNVSTETRNALSWGHSVQRILLSNMYDTRVWD